MKGLDRHYIVAPDLIGDDEVEADY